MLQHQQKFTMAFLGLVVLLLLTFASPTSSCTEKEQSSLLDFLAQLSPGSDSSLKMSWVHGADCCTWEGVTCRDDNMVMGVSLASKGLTGSISPSLGNLTGLMNLNLSHNSLHGNLPIELVLHNSIVILDVSFNHLAGPLKELQPLNPNLPLQVLNISSNFFTGQFPSTIWSAMKNLIALNASNNSFTGQIPASICISSPSFSVLDLCYNKFCGNIPPELGNCTTLRLLKAGHNDLSGALPHELFSATSLEHLSFPNNGLQGVFDGSQVVKLNNLMVLDLGSNGISGKIPNSIGQLRKLEELHLDNNLMYGEMPSTLDNCSNLRYINLRNNSFAGDLSKVNFTLLDLRIADFSLNYFTGRIPESIYSCSNLIALRLAYNNFHGQLSSRIGNLRFLSFLSLTNNSLSNVINVIQVLKSCKNLNTLIMGSNFNGETIPQNEGIDGFESLRVLTIDACPLVGKIPLWLSNLTKLEMLDLSNNHLTGQIPSWINNLQLLFYLDISNNSLAGDIPIALMNMPMIQSKRNAARLDPKFLELPVYWTPTRQYRMLNAFPILLYLGNNRFTGSIPPEIGQLKMLNALNFSSNNLSGEIPWQISNLKSLQLLDLSNNQLTGELPSALSDLHFLSIFNVSNNELEGPIPTGAQFDTFLNSSYGGNPNLCGFVLSHCISASRHETSTSREHRLHLAVIFGLVFGGLAALALLACFLIAKLVYDDHTENLVLLQRR
ncbi:Tyrosine-sulfated glycopeptide receptor 1 [Dichanthelium oligosanthes]|uniref:Tyrosine-sulfated glycopeptide receptor 1 n=1 Tax=Dichanthelium oligosanthes TaxID=888268 RepID=A0A1E5W661_9POAL|nr:Tyrosine-sulfated glycopeptide receptor 1 [Dichanthelium oligosanthes]